MKKIIILLIFILTIGYIKAQNFSDEIVIIQTSADEITNTFACDIDGDGDNDLISASWEDNKLAWYENTDGLGNFVQKIISLTAYNAMDIYSCDIDGDGDNDVLASLYDGNIIWHKNIDGLGNFGEQNVISTSMPASYSIYSCDIDGDGDNDVIGSSYSTNTIIWFENSDGLGTFNEQYTVTTSADGVSSIYTCDIDGDDDNDIISATFNNGKIVWFENTDGMGTFSEQYTITTSSDGAYSIYSSDIDNDGDNDVISASYMDDKIAWYENTDGQGTFGEQQIISTSQICPTAVYACDIDGDTDIDVLTSSLDNTLAWYENTDGEGNFSSKKIINNSIPRAHCVFACDIDGDTDIDVLVSSLDNIFVWHENIDGQGNFGEQNNITFSCDNPQSIFVCDINDDNKKDIITCETNKVEWLENTDGQGNFGERNIITNTADNVNSVYAVDIDGDGDNDILSTNDNKIVWHENTDAQGNFSYQKIITSSAQNATAVYSCDIDGDGDNDVLSASTSDDKIAWYENTDGQGNFGVQIEISTNAYHASSVYSCDIDGDGDNDVLSASKGYFPFDSKIAWYENTDGLGNFSSENIITTSVDIALKVFACDIDGDGDNDVLSASRNDNKIAWYENTDGLGNFSEQNIITTSAEGANSVYACDLDGDNDIDVLSTSEFDKKIAWYENVDGQGNFGEQIIIELSTAFPNDIFACDIDNDTDYDVFYTSSGKIAWFENLQINSVNNKTAKKILIYPNPTSSILNIKTTSNNIEQIIIMDLTGKTVFIGTNLSQNQTIDLSNFENGIYIISIQTDKEVYTMKILKK